MIGLMVRLIGIWLGIFVLFGTSVLSRADDSEIYTLQTPKQTLGGQGVHVILLIDNSGSFSWCIDQNAPPPQSDPVTKASPDPNCTDDTSTRTFQMRKVVTWFLNQLDPNTSVGLFTYGKDQFAHAAGGSMLAPLRKLNAPMASPAFTNGTPWESSGAGTFSVVSSGTNYTWKDYLLNWIEAPTLGSDANSPYYTENLPTNWLYQGYYNGQYPLISTLYPNGGTPLLAAYGEIMTYLKGRSFNDPTTNSYGDQSYDSTFLVKTGSLKTSQADVCTNIQVAFYNQYVLTHPSISYDRYINRVFDWSSVNLGWDAADFCQQTSNSHYYEYPTPSNWNSAQTTNNFMDNNGTYYPPDDYADTGGSCVAPSWHIIIITDGGANVATGMTQMLPVVGDQLYPGNGCNPNNAWDDSNSLFVLSPRQGPDGGDQIDYSCAIAEAYYLNNGKEPIPVPNSVVTDSSLKAPNCPGITSSQQCICKNTGVNTPPNCRAWPVTKKTISYDNGLGVNIHTHVIFIGPESVGSKGDNNGYNDIYDPFLMSQLADAGGGQFFTATTYQQLATALASITRQVIYQASTMTAPAVAVNQMNRFNFLDQLYYSEFQPSATSVWQGNLKRYWLHSTDGTNAPSSLIVADATGAAALNPTTQFFYNTARSCWGISGATATSCRYDTEDGNTVQLGGELQVMPIGPGTQSAIGRPIFVTRDNYTKIKDPVTGLPDSGHVVPLEVLRQELVSGNYPLTTAQTLFNSPAPADTGSLSNLMYWMEGLDLAKSNLAGSPPTYIGNYWMGDPFHSEGVLINYGYQGWTGGGTYGGTTNSSANLAAEQAAALDPSKQYNYILFSTNGGDLHAIDAYSGKEAMVWVPEEELPLQNVSMGSQLGTSTPSTTSSRTFGLDSVWTVWRHDGNGDNYIDPNNFSGTPQTALATNDWMYAYGGMRLGGSTIYALNLSDLDQFFRHPPGGWTNYTASTKPPVQVMWTIQGPLAGGYTQAQDSTDNNSLYDVPNMATTNVPANGSPFQFMGQSWSQPVLATIAWGSTTQNVVNTNGTTSTQTIDNPRQVLIFGGGYDPRDETEPYVQNGATVTPTKTFGPNLYGHQLYIVDAKTGALLFWASGGNPAGATSSEAIPTLSVKGMNYSITGKVQVVDWNNDGLADAIYVTDLGGQLWRFDLSNSGTNGGAFNSCSGNTTCSALSLGAVLLMQDGEAMPSAVGNMTEQRRFFTGVTAALMQRPGNNLYNNNPIYIGLAFGSGNDSHPRYIGTQDRLYFFEDHTLYGESTLNRSKGYTPPTTLVVGSTNSAQSNIVNVTNYAYSTSSTTTTSTQNYATLFGSSPSTAVFYINLSQSLGEKSLTMPTIFNGVVNATTYIPDNATVVTNNTCTPQIGTSDFWGFSAYDGQPELVVNGTAIRAVDNIGVGVTNMSLILDQGTAVYIGGGSSGGGSSGGGGTRVGSSLPNHGVLIRRWYQKH